MNKKIEQEKRVENYLEEYERLSILFQKDRFFFEQERQRLIDENIASWPDKRIRDILTSSQKRWEKILHGTGTDYK